MSCSKVVLELYTGTRSSGIRSSAGHRCSVFMGIALSCML